MENKNEDLMIRMTDKQSIFLEIRADRIGYNISKMISSFLNSQFLFFENSNDMNDIMCSMSSFLNNGEQIERALLLISYALEDEDTFLRLKELSKTLNENISDCLQQRKRLRQKLNDILRDSDLYLKSEEIQKYKKNIQQNIHLLTLEEDKSKRLFHMRVSFEEKEKLKNLSRKYETSMKNTILALSFSGNVFSWREVVNNDKTLLKENTDSLNNVAKLLNTSVKKGEELDELSMLSMISDMNVVDDFIRSDIDYFKNELEHFNKKIKFQIEDEGIYWTKSFKKKLENGKYGRE